MIELEQLPLWQSFANKANDEQRQMVRNLTTRAADLLDLVRDTFPTYTLHNRLHSQNVVQLMGELLGDRINDLTPLEGAILILSAYYHDIGMVFSESEKENLAEEPLFEQFKQKNPEAQLKLMKSGGDISLEIAEHYCRWAHGERVYKFLQDIEDKEIKWGVSILKNPLGDICASHVKDATQLLDDTAFRTDFLGGEADLRFCAILLRLADILDFDNSRTPEPVYKYLGLENRENPRKEISDIEWRKHLCTDGFKFPIIRNARYELPLVAGPDNPAVEHDVRQFLDIIETEIGKCERLLSRCCDRWRNFNLPYRIKRDDIRGQNYKYGEHRFTLDQNQALDLLMGENLYEEPYVFVRELLQNAIDTCRYHQFYEENKGNKEYEPRVDVSHWHDEDGYQWVRFDDNGMGMNEYKIVNYLLKVGKSYYQSTDFEIDKMNFLKHEGKDFTPISRFGIGILSCFITGDRVEINTRTIEGRDAIRLSLSGLHGFYIMQSENDHHKPLSMPSGDGNKEFFRKVNGTSIAIRLSPTKEVETINLMEMLSTHLHCSPINVFYKNKIVGKIRKDIENTDDKKVSTYEIEPEIINNEIFSKQVKFSNPFKIHIIPINLTRFSLSNAMKGQIIYAFLEVSKKDYELINKFKLQIGFRDLNHSGKGHLKIESGHSRKENIYCYLKLPDVCEKIIAELCDQHMLISHNGIFVTDTVPDMSLFNIRVNKSTPINKVTSIIAGDLALYDDLRPELSLSRERLNYLPWKVQSLLNLTMFRAISSSSEGKVTTDFIDFGNTSSTYGINLYSILQDPYINDDNGWKKEEIFLTNKGFMSILEIIEQLKNDKTVELIDSGLLSNRKHSFWDYCKSSLIQISINLRLRFTPSEETVIYADKNVSVFNDNLKVFPPLFFIHYDNCVELKKSDFPLNIEHQFSKWLIENARELKKCYPAIFKLIIEYLTETHKPFAIAYDLERINNALNRLRTISKSIAPPKSLNLKDSDFVE